MHHVSFVHRAVVLPPLLAYAVLSATIAGAATSGTPLQLVITAAADDGDPAQCGGATSVTVLRGQAVNLCYTVTNVGATDLHFQSLTGSADDGRLLIHAPADLPPGGHYTFNRIVEAGASTRTYTGSWLASDLLPGFAPAAAAYDFIDISATGVPTDSTTFNLPFALPFFDDGDTQTACLITSGTLQLFPGQQGPFGICGIATMQDNSPMPVDFYAGSSDQSIDLSNRFPVSWVATYWDHLADAFSGADGGTMYSQTVGVAPQRRFIAQWDQFHRYKPDGSFTPGTITFETILEEDTGDIVMQYADTGFDDPDHPEWDHGGDASVGLQFGMDVYDQYVYDEPAVGEQSAIAWTPNGAVVQRSNVASATVMVGAPQAVLTPSSIGATVEPGDTATVALQIRNDGDVPLNWSIDAARAAHRHAPRAVESWRPNAIASPPQTLSPAATFPLHGKTAERRSIAAAASSAYATTSMNTFDGIVYTFSLFSDASVPDSVLDIADYSGSATWYAGGFVDNDFDDQYVISYPDNQLLRIDTRDGSTHFVANVSGASSIIEWHGLKWDPTSGVVYAMGLDAEADAHLFHLDIGSGVAVEIAQITSDVAAHPLFVDIAIDADGTMFGLDISYDALFEIDKTTAAATPIGPLGFDANYAQGMDFDASTGVLYLAGYENFGGGKLYTIDADTGYAAPIGSFPNLAQYYAYAIASIKGPCATPQTVPWLSVTPSEGSTAPTGTSTVQVTLDSTGLTEGLHSATLCFRSDDPSRPGATLPVTFAVGTEAIFRDGFD